MGIRRLGPPGLLVLLVVAPGCVRVVEEQSAPVAPPRPTPLTFAFWAVEARETAVVHELATRFEQERPDIEVEVQDIPAKYYEKLMTLFAADEPPDVFVVNYGRLGDFARKDLLADLSPRLSADPELAERDFVPAAFEAFAGVGATIGRPGLYALPRDWGPTGLVVYDRSAFEAAGVACPTDGWTWTDFADACRKLTVRSANGEVTRYGGSVNLYPYSLIGWFRQNGGEVVSADGRRCTLDSAPCVQALEFIVSLAEEGVILPPDPAQDESLEAFMQGRAAMALVTPYAFGQLKECEGVRWQVAPPLVGKRRGCGCIPTGVAVSARSDQPEAAYALARLWVTEGAKAYAAAGLAVPAYRPALDSPELETGMGAQAARVVRATSPLAEPYPLSAEIPYEESLSALREALGSIFSRGEAPPKALASAASRLNSE